MEQLQTAMETGSRRYFDDQMPQAMPAACEQVAAFIQTLDVDLSRAAIGGFSQGAMVSGHAVLAANIKPGLLIQLSSTLVGHGLLDASKLTKPPVFQSHGRNDSVLPFDGSTALRDWFLSQDIPTRFIEFLGGHEIPSQVISALRDETLAKTKSKLDQGTISL